MTSRLAHYEAVTAIYTIQAGMVGLAYLLRWQSDTLIVPLYLILAGTSSPLYRRRAWADSHPRLQRCAFVRTGGFRMFSACLGCVICRFDSWPRWSLSFSLPRCFFLRTYPMM